MNEFFDTHSTYNILNAGRQSGKTYTLARLVFILGIFHNNTKILVAAPYNTQSDTFFYNVMQIERSYDMIKKSVQSPYKSIELINGSVIDFRSVDNPKSIRSKSYNYIFCDEFAFFKDGAFDLAIVPTLIASGNNCKLFFASTPNGTTGLFYDMAMKGRDVNEDDYSYYYMNYNDNPHRNLDIIESERLRQPSKRFNQEFLGEFIDDGGEVFEGIDDVSILIKYQEYQPGNRYTAGIDWGKVSDKSVLTILDKDRNVVFIHSYSGDWNKQINDMAVVLNKYRPIVYAESNGLGDPLVSQLRTKYSNIREFVTTNTSKKEIVEQLRMTIVLKDISLPTSKLCPELINEMTNYTYSLTKTGLITYHHKLGEHDDYLDSLMIANYAHSKHSVGFKAVGGRYSNFY